MSFFEHIPLAPADPILGLTAAFHKDLRREKVNLGVGLYKEEDLLTPVLSSVKIAEQALVDLEKSKEYLPIEGDSPFLQHMGELIFGAALWKREKERIASVQAVGGTGALHVGGMFLKKEAEGSVHIPQPSWPNHRGVFSDCGFSVSNYPYYDKETHHLEFEKMCAYFEALEAGSIIVLHACCHNPSGMDPTHEQWNHLSEVFKRKKLLPFFDCAYQGFGTGLEEDVYSIRRFAELGVEMLVAISCAKNFSIYAERVGTLFLVSATSAVTQPVLSRLRQVVRTDYSNPPMHGAKIVSYILGHSTLRKSWEEELKTMRERINTERDLLCKKLEEASRSSKFNHMKRGKGMFGMTGLTENQVERIIQDFGIYMTKDGRINFCGLNAHNIGYVVQSIIKVL